MSPKKVTIVVEKPFSFDVQDFLSALAHAQEPEKRFIMIDPDTGLRIINEYLNIPVIGLSFAQPEEKSQLGFPLPGKTNKADVDEVDDHTYTTEALVILDQSLAKLPEEMEGETWVIQVRDYENLDKYKEIAVALAEKFAVNIVMTPAHKRDDDPAHQEVQPFDPKFPASAPYCPIIVKRATPLE